MLRRAAADARSRSHSMCASPLLAPCNRCSNTQLAFQTTHQSRVVLAARVLRSPCWKLPRSGGERGHAPAAPANNKSPPTQPAIVWAARSGTDWACTCSHKLPPTSATTQVLAPRGRMPLPPQPRSRLHTPQLKPSKRIIVRPLPGAGPSRAPARRAQPCHWKRGRGRGSSC